MRNSNIRNHYEQMWTSTSDAWNSDSTIGKNVGLPDGYYKIGISIGSYFQPSAKLLEFLIQLSEFQSSDSNIVCIPLKKLHFTFLALAGHHYSEQDDIPTEISTVKIAIEEYLKFSKWQLQCLRIVPGRNFILLAGYPSEDLIASRFAFANALLRSPWAPFINSRHEYRGYPFPPVIWHTTLMRYKYELLPLNLRKFVGDYRDSEFGSVEMEAPKLRRVNYDWTYEKEISY